jgi:hypothetical protein
MAAGALALGSFAGVSSAGAQTATAPVVLDAGRRATYASLADTVLSGPSYRLGAAAGDAATADFEKAYRTWSAEARGRADRTLDALGRDYAKRSRKDREATLKPTGLERRQLALAEEALALVAVVTAADDDPAPREVTL